MPNVYAYRLKPSRKDHVEDLLAQNQIAIGWSEADVMDPDISWEAIRAELDLRYGHQKIKAQITKDTDQVWCFLKVLKIGDIVLVPHNGIIHFVQVTGEPIYLEEKIGDDTAWRRSVVKIREPIRRPDLPASVRARLNFQAASDDLSPVREEIFQILGIDPVVVAQEERSEQATRLLMEAIGSYQIGPKDEKTVERRHADVLKDLIKHLESKRRKVGNNRIHGLAPDLFTVGEEPNSLFEIKIGTGSGDYLKAIGQLLVYEKLLNAPYRKVMVAPPGLGDVARDILEQFDISIMEYVETDGVFDFGGF